MFVIIINYTDVSPLVELGETLVPGTELGAFLAASEGTPAQMILSVELVGIVIVHGVGEQIVPGSLVVDLKTFNIFHPDFPSDTWSLKQKVKDARG